MTAENLPLFFFFRAVCAVVLKSVKPPSILKKNMEKKTKQHCKHIVQSIKWGYLTDMTRVHICHYLHTGGSLAPDLKAVANNACPSCITQMHHVCPQKLSLSSLMYSPIPSCASTRPKYLSPIYYQQIQRYTSFACTVACVGKPFHCIPPSETKCHKRPIFPAKKDKNPIHLFRPKPL